MKKTYSIEVDCAACANKMEAAARKTSGVKGCTVDFMMQRMIVDFEDDADRSSVMSDVRKACKRIERDCEIFI